MIENKCKSFNRKCSRASLPRTLQVNQVATHQLVAIEMQNLPQKQPLVVILVLIFFQLAFSERAITQAISNGQQQYQSAKQAHFGEPETEANNVHRVAVGRSVKFRCLVNDIGDHKVSVCSN